MADDPLKIMEEIATYVSALTGMRQQLLDQGWSVEAAEQIVLHALKSSS